jgi:hypothetical protein
MGVDFYPCECCGHVFADCGYFVSCEGCGRYWCDDDCAESDGYICTEVDDGEDILEESTCSYCRGESFEDSEILSLALELLRKSHDELTKILIRRKEDATDGEK